MKFNKLKNTSKKQYFDIALALLMFITFGILVYTIVNLGVLSNIIYLGMGLIIILMFILTLLIFAKMPNFVQWIRRILIVLLCIALGFGSFYMVKIKGTISKVTTPESVSKINVSIIVRNDDDIKKVSDLSNKTIGIQNGNDEENGSYVKDQLSKTKNVKNVSYDEGLDYNSLIKKLMNEEIDALIITDSSYKLLSNEIADLEQNTSILKTWQRQKTNEVSSSTKDIRYDTFTIYLTGIDDVGSPDQNTRSDVNMLLIINPLANHIELVSIPRDAYVPNPALGNGVDKLTHTGNDGPENTVKAFEEVLGIDIDFYLKMSFTSVIEIIDTLGKIKVDVPLDFEEQDENRSFEEKDLIRLKKGEQLIDGREALALARHRKSYTDRDRTHAQQAIIKGIVDKLISKDGISKVNKLMEVVPKFIMTNMPMDQVTNFISYQLDHIAPWSISSTYIDGGQDAMLGTASMGYDLALSVYLLNRDDLQRVLDKYAEMNSQMKLADFKFDLNDLNKDRLTLPKNNGMVWVGDDTSKYEGSVEEETPEEPEVTEPETPEVPEVPEVPETPEPPITDPEEPVDPIPPVDPDNPGGGTTPPPVTTNSVKP